MGWIEKQKLRAHVWADRLSPIGKAARLYSWTFGGPLLWRIGKLGYQGVVKAMDGIRWTGYTAWEGIKGVGEMTVKPAAMLAASRITTVKRFLWDTPLAAVSAALRTPIALAKAPVEMALGVRDAITSIPRNAGEIFKAVKDLRLMDTMRATRDGILDILLPPIKRPFIPVITPAGEVISTGFKAEYLAVETGKEAVQKTIPEGFAHLKQAPSLASGKLAQVRAERDARKNQLAALNKAHEDVIQAKVDADKAADGGYVPPRLDDKGNVVVPGKA